MLNVEVRNKVQIITFVELALIHVGFEAFTAVTMENVIIWDVTPCGIVRTEVSEEHVLSIFRVEKSASEE
jgi:hypothetical protein